MTLMPKCHTYEIGDKVYVYRGSSEERGVTSKLAYKWDGPFTISKKIAIKTYYLRDDKNKRIFT